jgi:hypothetical protein
MKLNLSLENEKTEDLVRNYRSLQKLLGNASLFVQAIWREIRSRQKDKNEVTA